MKSKAKCFSEEPLSRLELADWITTLCMRRRIVARNAFNNFLQACAERVGQLITLRSLAQDAGGVSFDTVKRWLAILENEGAIFFLMPTTRIELGNQKLPKLYFKKTELLAPLLGLNSPEEIMKSHQWGSLFENAVILDTHALISTHGLNAQLTFWRDGIGREVDMLIELPSRTLCIEIKASDTLQADFVKHLLYLRDHLANRGVQYAICYDGPDNEVAAHDIHAYNLDTLSALFSE